jgi:rSAM/selenodomain-associated transferase 2
MDGGYYLIGLRQPFLFLFKGITWSTAQVLEQTCAIARAHGLRLHLLPRLSDVDYPEDLPIWAAATAPLSVIIPVLNEAASLERTLATVQTGSYLEVIVVDGGSQDQTVAIAQQWGAQVITTTPGRAHQMNVGAAAARGDLLLFLHGDTCLPLGFDALARRILSQTGVVGGAFMLQIEGQSPGLRLVEWGVKWRSRLFQLPYGDQAIFLKAATFEQIGGFAELPIMEDFVFIQSLRRLGRVAIAPTAVLTSGRRWQKLGVLKVTLINQLMIVGYRLGVSLVRLARWYRTWR